MLYYRSFKAPKPEPKREAPGLYWYNPETGSAGTDDLNTRRLVSRGKKTQKET